MKRLRCFVAMRFGEKDTDELYNRSIRPTLRDAIGKNTIIPIRVDLINHNQNIDRKIIEELIKCDFALADLTYARPSVYFEAGFAEGRQVPVIYTCRRDHFHPKADDKYGNFKVHFDVLMKNAIRWSTVADSAFKRNLRARVRLVVSPLVARKDKEDREIEDQGKFNRLSLETKLGRLLAHARERLNNSDYKEMTVDSNAVIHSLERCESLNLIQIAKNSLLWFAYLGSRNISWRWRRKGEAIRIICFVVMEKCYASSIRRLFSLLNCPRFDLNVGGRLASLRKIEEDYFVCVLGRVSLRQFSDVFRRYVPNPNSSALELDEKIVVPCVRVPKNTMIFRHETAMSFVSRFKDQGFGSRQLVFKNGRYTDASEEKSFSTKTLGRSVRIHLIGPIQSESDFVRRVKMPL